MKRWFPIYVNCADMEKLINESLLDAFIPVLHVSATPEMADANYEETLNNPFWQSK